MITVFVAYLAGLIFVVSGVAKLRDIKSLIGVVANYRIVPPSTGGLVARLLPPAEVIVGLALFFERTRAWATWVGVGMLLMFAAAMAINLARGRRHVSCGCLGARHRGHLTWGKVATNVLVAAILGQSMHGSGVARPEVALGALDRLAVMMAACIALACLGLTALTVRLSRRAAIDVEVVSNRHVKR